jgi:hypothetical protein
MYGAAWLQKYGSIGLTMDELADEWAIELRGLTGDEIRRGLQACRSSKFPPSIPEFIEFCRPATSSNRPSADEAWAIAIRAADEAETVVWTEEIAEAWGICRSVMDAGDEIGARMAFRAAYDRLTADARVSGTPAKWIVSQGHDVDRRAAVIEQARSAGLLPAPVVSQFVPLLESRAQPLPAADVAAKIAELRAITGARKPPERESEHERTRRLKEEAARRLHEHRRKKDEE